MLVATVSTQRSGTKLLLEIFNSGVAVRSFGEIFIPTVKFTGDFRTFLQTCGRTVLEWDNDHILDSYFGEFANWKITAFDIMFNQIEIPSVSWHSHDTEGIYGYLKSRKAVVIHLDRDLFDTYVSMKYLAAKSGSAHRRSTKEEFERLSGLQLNTADFERYCSRVCKGRDRLRDAMLDYEFFYELDYNVIAASNTLPDPLGEMISDCAARHHGLVIDSDLIQVTKPHIFTSDIDYSEAFNDYHEVLSSYRYGNYSNNGAHVGKKSIASLYNYYTAGTTGEVDPRILEKQYGATRDFLEKLVDDGDGLESPIQWHAIFSHLRNFFSKTRAGAYKNPITIGDGAAIMGFMAAIKPSAMIEVGAASGFSSAFIIQAAKNLGLAREGEVFLSSLDITDEYVDAHTTGSVLLKSYGDLTDLWQLYAPATTLELSSGAFALPLPADGSILAFIDGSHRHPWPLLDIIGLRQTLPRGSWLLIRDMQVPEGRPSVVSPQRNPRLPARGTHLAVSLWPGRKWIGQDLCFNMAALCLDIDDKDFHHFVAEMMNYPFECAIDAEVERLLGMIIDLVGPAR